MDRLDYGTCFSYLNVPPPPKVGIKQRCLIRLNVLKLKVFSFVFSEFKEIHHLMDNVCTVSGLLPGRTYSFRVKAINEAGVSYN